MGKEVNSDLSFDFALKGALCEAAREPNQIPSDLCDSAGSYIRGVGRLFLAADGRSVALYGAGEHKGNSPSVSAKNIAEPAPSQRVPKSLVNRYLSLFPPEGNRRLEVRVAK